ncbi:MAG: DUF3341 domain-containing protein [Hyphomicrobiales bacterium]|nr:DUF3341 domain-containing protein [Hyphomicrobiales bacterium]
MTRVVIAEFGTAHDQIEALRRLDAEGFEALDAMSPYRVAEVEPYLPRPRLTIRPHMALAGFGIAAFAYGLQWFSAAIAYPINSGARPLNSWPVFLLVPFEVGILAAAIAGFVALLVSCGLPRLHHPLFAYPGIERASQDRFFVLIIPPSDAGSRLALERLLFGAAALSLGEAQT